MRLFLFLSLLGIVRGADLVSMGCSRDPSLTFCTEAKATGVRTKRSTQSTDITENDKKACAELRPEFVKVCAMSAHHKPDENDKEFCTAFENICFRIPENEPDQKTVPKALITELTPMQSSRQEQRVPSTPAIPTRPTTKSTRKRINMAKFCKDFKNRYLFVCPDPFRFGEKAVIFCPIYSERCHVPLPDRPVVPTRKPPRGRRGPTAVQKLCRSYSSFARTYCNNPFFLSQNQYRQGCEKYWRFCKPRHRQG